jgi:hypothetical protein
MGRPSRSQPRPAGPTRRGFFTRSGVALALAGAPVLALAHDDDGGRSSGFEADSPSLDALTATGPGVAAAA